MSMLALPESSGQRKGVYVLTLFIYLFTYLFIYLSFYLSSACMTECMSDHLTGEEVPGGLQRRDGHV